ncbi:hypothetical protein Rs2_42935 [Raphanus sativus]|nr:hypothetical protein Rs2_42935 [Raphanus sativus]
MSTSKVTIFCIVLLFLTSFHECANLKKTTAACVSRPQHKDWCCNVGHKQCRIAKSECERIYAAGERVKGEGVFRGSGQGAHDFAEEDADEWYGEDDKKRSRLITPRTRRSKVLAKKNLERRIKSSDFSRKLQSILIKKVRGL